MHESQQVLTLKSNTISHINNRSESTEDLSQQQNQKTKPTRKNRLKNKSVMIGLRQQKEGRFNARRQTITTNNSRNRYPQKETYKVQSKKEIYTNKIKKKKETIG